MGDYTDNYYNKTINVTETNLSMNITDADNVEKTISYVSADMGGINYSKITPKVILNKNIWTKEYRNDISNRTSDKTLQGVNIIDVDWNGAYLPYSNTYIYNSSDLLKQIDKTNNITNYWSEVNEDELPEEISEEPTTE